MIFFFFGRQGEEVSEYGIEDDLVVYVPVEVSPENLVRYAQRSEPTFHYIQHRWDESLCILEKFELAGVSGDRFVKVAEYSHREHNAASAFAGAASHADRSAHADAACRWARRCRDLAPLEVRAAALKLLGFVDATTRDQLRRQLKNDDLLLRERHAAPGWDFAAIEQRYLDSFATMQPEQPE